MSQIHFGDVVDIKMADGSTIKGLVVGSNNTIREGHKVPCAYVVEGNPNGAVPLFTEVIPGVGVALLDTLFTPLRDRLTREGHKIDESRHEDVGRRIRYQFGG
ncbi:hypothetical protein [Nonomuraea endophytica]|uniref:Uncharacterized protein n=1 Tax=Nonomuraea endophytica TaxID=714136 RepID=A0A7W8AD22_9ACTN|nr:hypothetical protein [Nonomuraea endophytica]MBB5084014.1 hypothetical protein [Nonomuraea endophytica]